MGRLSHIDDVERRNNEQQQESAGQSAVESARRVEEIETAPVQAQESAQAEVAEQTVHRAQAETAEQEAQRIQAMRAAQARATQVTRPEQRAPKTQAEQDADFHGLNDTHKKSSGHTALVIVAVVVFIIIAINVCLYNIR